MEKLKAKLWELEQQAKAIQLQAQKALEPIQKEWNDTYAEFKNRLETEKSEKSEVKEKKK